MGVFNQQPHDNLVGGLEHDSFFHWEYSSQLAVLFFRGVAKKHHSQARAETSCKTDDTLMPLHLAARSLGTRGGGPRGPCWEGFMLTFRKNSDIGDGWNAVHST